DRIYNTTEYETAFEAYASEHEIPTNNRSRNQSEIQYPPLNDLPPAYDTAYGAEMHLHGLRHNANFEAYKAGPKAWKMVIYDQNANDLVSVSDRGRTVTFHGKNDAMLNNDDSSQLNSNIVNSTISNNIPPLSDLPPNYEQNDGHKFNNDGLGGRTYGERWGDVGDIIADNKCKVEVNFGDGEKEFRFVEARG
ncbi:144_t:CDS:2, partial [Racocetra fulgida]